MDLNLHSHVGMLPFLKPRKYTSVMANTKPEGGMEMGEPEEENMGLHSAMEDLISAVHSKDAAGAREAFQAAHDICSSCLESTPDSEDFEE